MLENLWLGGKQEFANVALVLVFAVNNLRSPWGPGWTRIGVYLSSDSDGTQSAQLKAAERTIMGTQNKMFLFHDGSAA